MRRQALKTALACGLSLASFSTFAKSKSRAVREAQEKREAREANEPDPRILGRWKSDRERTLSLWRLKPDSDEAERERVTGLFGKLSLRYTANFVNMEFEGKTIRNRYRIVANDERSVVIEYEEDGSKVLEQVFFEDDYLFKVAGYNIEFFRRVKT